MKRVMLATGSALLLATVPASAFAGQPASHPSPIEAFVSVVTTTLLGPPEGQTGQPFAECGEEEAPNTPGHASTAPGSAFNEDGTAHGVYAGEQPQNSKNTASVSQYDSACLHVPSPH